ncbi:hypothetical protein T12_11811 [Trichinella patagoniensis]|uniref:Uncharacterized protein n=1 Tax=Trichinella patagoniensis TaxID=990121 RepID=A0A0V1A791_9BILA|nr:hypothetical protein T06_15420 [Trichinella sp. T6]KRY20715.1 hypothetical protein T12_11811 [Trichinella patagoniensis]
MQQKQCCCDDAAYTNATEYYISPKLFELNVGRIEISKLHFTFKVLKKHCPAKQIRHRYDEQKQYFYTMAQDVFPRINLLFLLLLALLLMLSTKTCQNAKQLYMPRDRSQHDVNAAVSCWLELI